MTKEQEDSIEILKNAIADSYNRITNPLIVKALETVLYMLEEKNKEIDLMANEIDSLHYSLIDEFGTWKTEYSKQGEEATIEEVKQYFENKAKEV